MVVIKVVRVSARHELARGHHPLSLGCSGHGVDISPLAEHDACGHIVSSMRLGLWPHIQLDRHASMLDRCVTCRRQGLV